MGATPFFTEIMATAIKKILIIDDSPVARMILKKSLSSRGDYEIFEAGDGQAGLEKFLEVRPDVTFLDLTMPVMDGFEILPKILEIDPKAMIIVATADIQAKTVFKIMELGALKMLKKPVVKDQVHALLEEVEGLLETRNKSNENE